MSPLTERQSRFREELGAHRRSMLWYAKVLLSSTPSYDADDLVHDTLLLALDHEDQFKPGTDMRAWLNQIMRNKRVNDLRDDHRFKRQPKTLLASFPEASSGGQDAAVEISDLRRGMMLLAPGHETMVIGAAIGESQEETAERTGLPIGSVKSTISRGRHFLRRFVDGDASPYSLRQRAETLS